MHSIAHFTPKVRLPRCPICNEAVEIETSKTDENGKAIHEECYVAKIIEHRAVLLKDSRLSKQHVRVRKRKPCSGSKTCR